jgi:YNFM family putative membrane transporter
MTTGILLTLMAPLSAIVTGIIVFTIGFFGAHTVASAWVGARAATARAQASSLYLLAYYLGSSVSGTGGGLIWSHWGWPGLVALILGLLALAGLVVLRLTTLAPLRTERAATPGMAARYGAAAE